MRLLHRLFYTKIKAVGPVISTCQILRHSSAYSRTSAPDESYSKKYHMVYCGVLGLSCYVLYKLHKNVAWAEPEKQLNETAGVIKQNLPYYKQSDIEKHKSKETGVWVTYKNGVYDISEFVDKHPGGNKVLLAAGGSVEPFWLLYGVHNNSEVHAMLEEYRIGNLDVKYVQKNEAVSGSDPYELDPARHPALKPASIKPFNAEPPPSLLVDKFDTPNELFYVRNHLPVPQVDLEKFRVTVSGIGVKATTLSLKDIKKLPAYEVSAAVQCAGNRRSEMTRVRAVKGLSWQQAAIGNATWRGARLTDVLRHCGLKSDAGIAHVQFEGLDHGPDHVPYGASVPAEKALDPKGDVLLAYEMNGEPLSPDHGFPLRVVVPGVVGARNVKWVTKIVLSDAESDSHWQQNDYKGFSPTVDWDTVDFKSSPAIQELPVISAICSPEEGEKVETHDGAVTVKGYAWSGGGRSIVRVDVSCDKGRTWHTAELAQRSDKPPHHWAWTLWTASVPVQSQGGEVEIWAKAVDSSYNTQPESFENIWNLRGVLSNAYHRIKVTLSV